MPDYLIKNVKIVNENSSFYGDVLLKGERIAQIGSNLEAKGSVHEISGEGKVLIPGVIDDHVHFREPGLTHKAEIATETRAAVAGGVTSFMEMPNTKPPAITMDRLEEKYSLAKQKSVANYSFYMGVANGSAEEVLKANQYKDQICGVKIFMGSSTGNMLVDDRNTLEQIFKDSELVIATHCEDEEIIHKNLARLIEEKGEENLTPLDHPIIRDVEACYVSTKRTVELAQRFGSRLHVVHVTTGKELALFDEKTPLEQKRITAEVCTHHLWFSADDYDRYGNKIKCNPAIKAKENREALWKGLEENRLDLIATDNAPHTLKEKSQPYYKAPSGIPLVQHSLLMMLAFHEKGQISLEQMVNKMCHAPAVVFGVRERGFIREGYYADLVLLDLHQKTKVSKENILYKCGWSPFEDEEFPARIEQTFVNGRSVYEKSGIQAESGGKRLTFKR